MKIGSQSFWMKHNIAIMVRSSLMPLLVRLEEGSDFWQPPGFEPETSAGALTSWLRLLTLRRGDGLAHELSTNADELRLKWLEINLWNNCLFFIRLNIFRLVHISTSESSYIYQKKYYSREEYVK